MTLFLRVQLISAEKVAKTLNNSKSFYNCFLSNQPLRASKRAKKTLKRRKKLLKQNEKASKKRSVIVIFEGKVAKTT